MSAKILPFTKTFIKPQESAPEKDSFCGSTPNEKWPEIVDSIWRDKIIAQYTPLVNYIASQQALRLPTHISNDDLVSSGIIGLIDAIRKFDPKKGIKFKTYAGFRIKGTILDELRSLDWIPRSVREKQRTLKQARAELEKTLVRSAEPEEIAVALGIDMDELHELQSVTKVISLSDIEVSPKKLLDEKTDRTGVSDQNKEKDPIQALYIFQLQNIVAQCIKELPYGMQLLLSLYFYEELTMGQISFLAGCSESRISQLLAEALREIKPELAKRLGISNYTFAISVDRHRERPPKKSLLSLPKTLIWSPEKPGDDDPREKEAPNRWKNFGEKISEKISSLHAEKKGEGKMNESRPARIPGITMFLPYSIVIRLRKISESKTKTEDILALTSGQFVQKFSELNPRSIQTVAEKMIKNNLNFRDGVEATRDLERYDPQTYILPAETPAPAASAPPDSPAASAKPEAPASVKQPPDSVVASAEPDPASFEAILRKLGSVLDKLEKEDNIISNIFFSGNAKGPGGKYYKITIDEIATSTAE